jgi:hypothetical protein
MAPFETQHVLIQGGQAGGPSLPSGTRRNASFLANALTDPEAAGVDPKRCHTLFPQTREDVLHRVAKSAASADGLLVYWTGHCRLERDGSLHLAVAAQPDHEATEWLPARDLVQMMSRSRSRDRLLILDTCLAPHTLDGVSQDLLRREIDRLSRAGIAVLSSIGASPLAFAANGHTPSVFTLQLATLLHTPPDTPAEQMNLRELHRLLTSAMRNSGYLRPTLRNAQGFNRPVMTVSAKRRQQQRSEHLLVRWRAHTMDHRPVRRYALAVAGAKLAAAPAHTVTYEPADDAAAVYHALLGSYCGFTRDTASLLSSSVTSDGLFDAIANLAGQGQNMALFYLACHGSVRSSGRALDLALDLQDDETVLASELVRGLRKARAENVLLMLDVSSADASTPLAPLTDRFSPSSPRPGFSRLLIEWTRSSSRLRMTDSVSFSRAAASDDQCPVPWGRVPEAVSPGGWNWLFDFPGAAIRCLDDAGPLRSWARLLHDSIPGDLLTRPGEALSSILDHPLQDEPPLEPADSADPGNASQPNAPEHRTARTRAAEQQDPPTGPVRSSAGSGPRRPVHRRHRARLRIAQDALPLQVGQHFRVTFNYQPQGPDWSQRADDATDDYPVDLTLRIGAGTANVNPSIIHTQLTDGRGTPPEAFRITPRSTDPVTLRIEVVRSADGAVIQRIKSTLKVTDRDGADR